MTWRAFIIGLLAVFLIAAVAPYNDWELGNTYLTGNHFPPGPLFILLFLVLGANVVLKLMRRAWALTQQELMLIFCMMLVSSTVPSCGLMRLWFSMQVSPAYYRHVETLPYQEEVLANTPDDLVLTKDADAVPVRYFFEGRPQGEPAHLYLDRWLRPMSHWLIFIGLFYLGTIFLTGMLRKQWVEVERLSFPLARVPLDVTEGAEGAGLVPAVFRNGAFIAGLAASLVFGAIRLTPLLVGKTEGWLPEIGLSAVLTGTPFANAEIWWGRIFPIAMGIAYLVPADVALSVWFFYFFTRVEIAASYWVGKPMEGGSGSPFMHWQQAGVFVVLTLLAFWSARRHLWALVRKALFIGDADDSAEPISYRLAFWGAVVTWLGMLLWLVHYGVHPLTGLALLGSMLCILVVHARVVCQGGIFFTHHNMVPPTIINVISGGRAFPNPTGAVVALLQNSILLQDAREILSPHAMNALRVASVFTRRRRLLLPAVLAAIAVSLAVSSVSTLYVSYNAGGLNFDDTWSVVSLPKDILARAGRIVTGQIGEDKPQYPALALGAAIMFAVSVMRARFYWWPLHSLGFPIAISWSLHNLWLPFLLAWFIKVLTTRFGGGGALRTTRRFFLGVIIGEVVCIGLTTLVGVIWQVNVGKIFLPT